MELRWPQSGCIQYEKIKIKNRWSPARSFPGFAPQRVAITSDDTRRHRGVRVSSGKWRNRLVAWIANGDCVRVLCLLGSSRFCLLVSGLFSFGLSLFVIVLSSSLFFGFSLVPPSSEWYRMTYSLYSSSVEEILPTFWPTHLYKASLYVDSCFSSSPSNSLFIFIQDPCILDFDTMHLQCISFTRLLRYSLEPWSLPLVSLGILRYTLRYLAVFLGTRSLQSPHVPFREIKARLN
jgi:hypothetical protein